MIIEEPQQLPQPRRPNLGTLPWLRILIGLLITAASIWFLAREVALGDLLDALRAAHVAPIVPAVLVILVTGLAKAWRWQLLFVPAARRPAFTPTYWALMLGQMLNLLSPIPRLGELARIYRLHIDTQTSRGQALGTIVSEKSLDMLTTVLAVLVLLPWIVVPQFIQNPTLTLAGAALAVLAALYLLAFQTAWVLNTLARLSRTLPETLRARVLRLAGAMLNGLAALRDARITLQLLAISLVIAFLSVATPWLLFPAFDLPFGFVEGLLLNTGITLSLSLPAAPARIGWFEGVTYALLAYFGAQDGGTLLGYAIVYHVVVVLPPLLIGGYAALTGRWDWRNGSRNRQQV